MIHTYKLNGYNIVVDASSGAVHSVDDAAYDAVELCDAAIRSSGRKPAELLSDAEFIASVDAGLSEKHRLAPGEVQELMGDLAELHSMGQLWSTDPFEAAADEIKLKQSVLKAICLHVAHGCNMDCEYCFAGKGDYSGKAGIMSSEVGKRALDYLVENSGSRRHLEVDFFGGEPLINWDVCKEIVAYGREIEKKTDKIFNFTLTTNGVLIDEDVIEFTNREMGNVVLSMDGRQSTHDRMRHSKTGAGTYDTIMDNFKALVASRTNESPGTVLKDSFGPSGDPSVSAPAGSPDPAADGTDSISDSKPARSVSAETGKAAAGGPQAAEQESPSARRSSEYYMRGTYTAYNKDFASDVLAMADLGFKETSIEPVVADPSAPYALHDEDLPQLFEEYEKLAVEMLAREEHGEGFSFYHYTVDLTGGPCIYKRVAGCGVSTEYLAVTPTGDLYPCHQFVGDDDMIVGNIYEGITHPETVAIFTKGNNIYTRDKCRNCWARLYCAGGCAANNFHSNGDINKVYEFGCKLHRKRMECALMMAVARQEREG